MDIGNRKTHNKPSIIPTFTKLCYIDNLNCNNCTFYDNNINWCIKYIDIFNDYLKQGYKLK